MLSRQSERSADPPRTNSWSTRSLALSPCYKSQAFNYLRVLVRGSTSSRETGEPPSLFVLPYDTAMSITSFSTIRQGMFLEPGD